ncbi:hypothetical protein [Microbacterium jejuense]|uniref:hypothetical protein n=1 Tax=Microbacterium jejuense TaxID=1263637 RepID=UPI0031E5245C
MDKPIINRRFDGEYSTVLLPGGIIETMWFPHDPDEREVCVGRSTIAAIAQRHIADHTPSHSS